jgi:hypothetical protein
MRAATSSRASVGRFEGIEHGAAFGWVLAPKRLQTEFRVELLDGKFVVASGNADRLHQMLGKRIDGDARYAFSIPLPQSLADGRENVLDARVDDVL